MRILLSSFLLVMGTISAPIEDYDPSSKKSSVWQPAVGTKWQIVISNPVDTSKALVPSIAQIYDVDLFYQTPEDIATMKSQGKKVICYFSAGSAENWRPDYGQFAQSDIGTPLEGWEGENWLNIRSASVLNIMKNRIKLASTKGCDAIDPDNMDGYSNGGGGFQLSQSDSINYLRAMAQEAASYGLSTGLKNAQEILPQVLSDIQFAVNEQCVATEGDGACTEYNSLLSSGKPVLHIEYADQSSSGNTASPSLSQDQINSFCLQGTSLGSKLSTVIKKMSLNGWVTYCDGSVATTAMNMTYNTGDPKQTPGAGVPVTQLE